MPTIYLSNIGAVNIKSDPVDWSASATSHTISFDLTPILDYLSTGNIFSFRLLTPTQLTLPIVPADPTQNEFMSFGTYATVGITDLTGNNESGEDTRISGWGTPANGGLGATVPLWCNISWAYIVATHIITFTFTVTNGIPPTETAYQFFYANPVTGLFKIEF